MSNPAEVEALSRKIKQDSAFLDKLYEVTGQVIVGQQHMLDRLLIGLLTKGHILLEGMPGLAVVFPSEFQRRITSCQNRHSHAHSTPNVARA